MLKAADSYNLRLFFDYGKKTGTLLDKFKIMWYNECISKTTVRPARIIIQEGVELYVRKTKKLGCC